MSRDQDTVKSVLRWIAKAVRYRSEAASRWGHYYDMAVSQGYVREGEREAFMNGRLRDIRTPVFLTDEGKEACGG